MTWKRVATAVVLIPGVVALVLWTSTAIIAIALAAIILLALFEFFALGDAIGHRAYRFWTATCALLLVFVQWAVVDSGGMAYVGNARGATFRQNYGYIFGLLVRFPPNGADVFFVFLIGLMALTLATKRPMVEALPAAGISSSALVLVALPLTFAIRIHAFGFIGPYLLLFALIITWVGDTVAYFVGRAIGKHKFAPILSPKKTWEGAIASLFGALLVAVVFARYINIPQPHLLGMAAVGNVAGQMGDLFESAFKRSAGVKDSGTLLPGHGGVLDRIDALILTIPVVWYYWIWVYLPTR
jgi:phosphatidate cytidylyltransferase